MRRASVLATLAGVCLGLVLAFRTPVERLEEWHPAIGATITDRNGVFLADLSAQRRYPVHLDQLPATVVNAFIAAEDARFWRHPGVDPVAVARAALFDIAHLEAAQGGSTITQQLVRMIVLGDRAKTVRRKVTEGFLALAAELRYDKKYILTSYLNNVYFGASAYGVEAAARTYFGKHAWELDLAQAALLAGIIQRPSDFNPRVNPRAAKIRRQYVLNRMVTEGMISRVEADRAAGALLALPAVPDTSAANAFIGHARRVLVQQLGAEVVRTAGLTVRTTCDLELQRSAMNALRNGTSAVERHTGWRPDLKQFLDAPGIRAWRDEEERRLGGDDDKLSALPVTEPLEGAVLAVTRIRLVVGIGHHEIVVPFEGSEWVNSPGQVRSFLSPADRDGDGRLDGPRFVPGDRVVVQVDGEGEWIDASGREYLVGRLVRRSGVQGALLSMDLATGDVLAMVGGLSSGRADLNRAVAMRRPVGSVMKPIVYGAGIAAGLLSADTLVDDRPVQFPGKGGVDWAPRSSDGAYLGLMTASRALAESRNGALVSTLHRLDIGMRADLVHQFARSLGLGSQETGGMQGPSDPRSDRLCPWVEERSVAGECVDHQGIEPGPDPQPGASGDEGHLCRACDYTVGLGSSALSLAEVVRAYAAFGAEGVPVEPRYILEVRDAAGRVIWAPKSERLEPAIDPVVAGVVRTMLEGVVESGTARKARALGVPVAGKTGTSQGGRDAWFVGLTPGFITGVWVGYDRPASLGPEASGGRTALPIWMEYNRALHEDPRAFDEVPGTEVVWVNPTSGKAVPEGRGIRVRRAAGSGAGRPWLASVEPSSVGTPLLVSTSAPPRW